MAYNPIGWQNSPSTSTPLDAANLSAMDAGIENAYGLFGTFATMPVASAVNSGIIYFATDTHQTFQSNGTAWVLLPAGSIAGAPVASTAPTTGQVLTYNGTDWVPQASTVPTNSWINMTVTSGNTSIGALPSMTSNLYAFSATTVPGTALPAPSPITFSPETTTLYGNLGGINGFYSGGVINTDTYGQPFNFPYSTQSADNNFTWAPATGLLTVATAGMYRFELSTINITNAYTQSIALLANGTSQILASTNTSAGYFSNALTLALTANQPVNIFNLITGNTNIDVFYLGSLAVFLEIQGGAYLPTASFTVTKL